MCICLKKERIRTLTRPCVCVCVCVCVCLCVCVSVCVCVCVCVMPVMLRLLSRNSAKFVNCCIPVSFHFVFLHLFQCRNKMSSVLNGESDFLPVLGSVEFCPCVILVVDWAVDTKHQSTRPGFLFHWLLPASTLCLCAGFAAVW